AGIAVYFRLLVEPGAPALGLLAAFAALVFLAALRTGIGALALPAMVSLGVLLAAGQTERVRAPVLDGSYRGAILGRVVHLDRSASNAPRITLDRVYLPGWAPAATPSRVRVSLSGHIGEGALRPGARVALRGWIAAPNPPVEPGDFDFRRHAWFAGIGAVGYTRDPVVLARDAVDHSLATRIFALRLRISAAIRARLPGAQGGFAAAILTGDRSAIDPSDLDALRASNLAHLLAISGLHMGLLTGFLFAALRIALALFPRLAMRLPAKKLAAVVALLGGLFYLALSGASVATQRAFIMAAVALGAILIDRPALTLRAVALAALIVLFVHPVSLLGPGFQMSFAATAALVATYERLGRLRLPERLRAPAWRPLRRVFALVLTSAVAGLATAPFSAFHFNAVARFGLLANVVAVPAMGLLVMPAAVAAGLLLPLGLDGPAFTVMGAGIGHILGVAHWIAGLEGARWYIPAGPPLALSLISLGGVMVILMRGPLRLGGIVALAAALLFWATTPRPDVLIAEDGRLVGVQGPGARALSAARGNRFAARVWLENDGRGASVDTAYLRPPLHRATEAVTGGLPAGHELYWTGAKTVSATACREKMLVIAPAWTERPVGKCVFIGREALWQGGAHAIRIDPGGKIHIATVGAASGDRPWTQAGRE
ncbi:MAG: ComEC/Rec2 family competence protein, partial [Pseudomonadota bacterium]